MSSELVDEPITAYRPSEYYHEVPSNKATTSRRAKDPSGSSSSCCSRFCSCLCSCISWILSLGFMAVAAYMLWNLMGRPSKQQAINAFRNFDVDDFVHVLKNLTDVEWDMGFNEDPYVGDNTTNVWRTDGTGLTLVLWNALDENWQTEFEAAVSDWSESEVLTLSTKQVDVDHSCTMPKDGVMKVCNGNFGATSWVGINEVALEYTSKDAPGYIVSSVAKMNEYYLNNAEYAKRQYTMCHGTSIVVVDTNYFVCAMYCMTNIIEHNLLLNIYYFWFQKSDTDLDCHIPMKIITMKIKGIV